MSIHVIHQREQVRTGAHAETFGVAELLYTLGCVYELGVRVHDVRPELVHVQEAIQVGQL